MRLWRQIGRQRWAKVTIGVVAAEYLRFVGNTTRFTLEPADIYTRGEADMPIILAFWHGQHLLAPMARQSAHKVNMLVSHHRDGEVNAIAARRFGVGTIRGSGNHGGGFVHKAGVAAFQAMLDSLAEGCSIAMSADVPKVARVAGLGIIKLAQASGRPIYPRAAATCSTIGTAPRSICRSGAAPASLPNRSPFHAMPTAPPSKRHGNCSKIGSMPRRGVPMISSTAPMVRGDTMARSFMRLSQLLVHWLLITAGSSLTMPKLANSRSADGNSAPTEQCQRGGCPVAG
jgi:lysophospholipid acyltransferase (LPLAT)-like uncharacterized protein